MEKPKDLRFFKIGDIVFYDELSINDGDLRGIATIELIDGQEQDGELTEDSIVTLRKDDNSVFEGYGDRVYKIAEDISEKIGELVCWEHEVEEYEFFLPDNDENYYACELGLETYEPEVKL